MTIKVIVKKDSNGNPRLSIKGETTIYVRYQHNSKVADFQACKIAPKSIELVEVKGKLEIVEPYIKQRVKGRLDAIENIDLVKRDIKAAVNRLLAKGIEPMPKIVKREFEAGFVQGPDEELRPIIKDVFRDYINAQSHAGVAKGTLKQYNSTLNHIESFHKSEGFEYAIDQVDLNYYDALVSYLKVTHRGITKESTVGKNIKTLKSMLRWARSRGYDVHPDVDLKAFKVAKSTKKVYYLTEDEVNRLLDADLSDTHKLARVRDRFVFNCYVGLRVGDLNRLNVKHIQTIEREGKRVKLIEAITEKQKKRGLIPLKPIPLSILEKYDYSLPNISDQKYNMYLKELLKKVEIDRAIEIAPGEFEPLYSLVTSHLAVKTFITLCHKWGIPTKHVASITGKTEKVINEYYYAVSDEDLIDVMLFNNQ